MLNPDVIFLLLEQPLAGRSTFMWNLTSRKQGVSKYSRICLHDLLAAIQLKRWCARSGNVWTYRVRGNSDNKGCGCCAWCECHDRCWEYLFSGRAMKMRERTTRS